MDVLRGWFNVLVIRIWFCEFSLQNARKIYFLVMLNMKNLYLTVKEMKDITITDVH